MAEEKIRVLVCRVGQSPTIEEVPNKFETWQKLVEGYVQFVPLGDGIEMVCNEDGSHTCLPNCYVPGLAPNVKLSDYSFVIKPMDAPPPGELGIHKTFGTIIIARTRGNHALVSLTDEDAAQWATAILAVTKAVESPSRDS